MNRLLLATLVGLTLATAAAEAQDSLYALEVVVLEPESLRTAYEVGAATFGPQINYFSGEDIEGEIAPVGSPSNSTELACETVGQDLTGRVALVKRGGCLFVEKVRHVQAAGATAALIFNNVEPGGPADSFLVYMGSGSQPSDDIVIPSAFMRAAAGVPLRDASPGVVVRLQAPTRCYGPTTGIPDPTEPERYYPLAVGNAWEYAGSCYPPEWCGTENRRLDVLRDSLVDGERYLIMRDARYSTTDPTHPTSVSTTLVRFDADLARVARANGTVWRETPCPLDADSGVTLNNCDFYRSWEVVVSAGPVQIGNSTVQAVQKEYEGCYGGVADIDVTDRTYAADIGLVREFTSAEGGSHTDILVYARVGGQEYGSPVVWPVAGEPLPQTPVRTEIVAAYPNPFRERVVIAYRLAVPAELTLEVFDVLGRRVHSAALGPRPAGAHEVGVDGSALAPGLYVVRLTGEGVRLAQPLVRAR